MSTTYDHIPFRRNWTISNQTWRRLGECEAYVHALIRTPILPDERHRLQRLNLAKGVKATTAIEGNTLSLEAVEDLVNHAPAPKAHLKYGEREVVNLVGAFTEIAKELLTEGHTGLITTEFIQKCHRRICAELADHYQLVPGEWRKGNVKVSEYRPPDHAAVPDLMLRLCNWLQTEFHYPKGYKLTDGIIQAVVTHYYLNAIHPFSDGNGRTARLIEFYLLLRAGVPDVAAHGLSNFYNDRRDEYYTQLRNADKTHDLSSFISFAVEGLSTWMLEAVKMVQNSTFIVVWNSFIRHQFDVLVKGGNLNAAQKRKRSLAFIIPTEGAYSAQSLLDSSGKIAQLYRGLSDKTLQRDLASLVEMKLLVKEPKQAYTANVALIRNLQPSQVSAPLQ